MILTLPQWLANNHRSFNDPKAINDYYDYTANVALGIKPTDINFTTSEYGDYLYCDWCQVSYPNVPVDGDCPNENLHSSYDPRS